MLDYGILRLESYDIPFPRFFTLVSEDGFNLLSEDGYELVTEDYNEKTAVVDYGILKIETYDIEAHVSSITIRLLKTEFCRFEDNYKKLKVRITIDGIYNPLSDNLFTAKIINEFGMEYDIDNWEQTIGSTTTKLIKEYDLNSVSFDVSTDSSGIYIPLNIGTHTLQVSINGTTQTETFKVVPLTVESMKNQYLLGVNLESSIQLELQQELRLITGVEVTEISRETSVGSKELVWNATNSTLQWDFGEPVVISEDYTDYILLDAMATPGIVGGDYIRVSIPDYDDLPSTNQTEICVVDVKKYDVEEFQYWIDIGYQTLKETVVMVDIEPTLYSSDKSLGYKYFDPVMNVPKNFSETTNISFEFPVNMLQEIIELWARHRGAEKVNIDLERIEFSQDGQVVIRGFPGMTGIVDSMSTIGMAGLWDKTMYAKNHPGSRNKVKNFWNATLISGIPDNEKELRNLALSVIGLIASIQLLLIAGLGKGAGVASRSFSVGGISSSYSSTESAENSLFSGIITDIQNRLGIGKASAQQQKTGLIALLKNRILGGSMAFKY